MIRSCYIQRDGSNSDADSPLHGSSLHAFQHAMTGGQDSPMLSNCRQSIFGALRDQASLILACFSTCNDGRPGFPHAFELSPIHLWCAQRSSVARNFKLAKWWNTEDVMGRCSSESDVCVDPLFQTDQVLSQWEIQNSTRREFLCQRFGFCAAFRIASTYLHGCSRIQSSSRRDTRNRPDRAH